MRPSPIARTTEPQYQAAGRLTSGRLAPSGHAPDDFARENLAGSAGQRSRLQAAAALAAIFLAYAVLAAGVTYPLIFEASNRYFAPLDSWLNTYVLTYVSKALFSGQTGATAFLDGLMFYPASHTLGMTEWLPSDQLVFAPVYLATANPFLAYNMLLFLSLPLTATALFLLLRDQGVAPASAFLAGALFAFSPAMMTYFNHVQLVTLWWTPLAVLFLLRFCRGSRLRDLGLTLTLFALQIGSSLYVGVFLMTVLAVLAITNGGIRRGFRCLRARPAATSAVLLFGVCSCVVVTLPQIVFSRTYGAVRTVEDNIQYSSDPRNFFSVFDRNIVYSGRDFFERKRSPFSPWEKTGFPGLLPIALAAIGGAVFVRRRFRSHSSTGGTYDGLLRDGLVLGAVGVIFALGPELVWHGERTGIPLPYRLFLETVYPFKVIRVPARWVIVALFGACLVAAWVLSQVERSRALRPSARRAALAVILALGVAEMANKPLNLDPAELTSEEQRLVSWIRSAEFGAAQSVLFWPATEVDAPGFDSHYQGSLRAAKWSLLAALMERPVVNGYSGYTPEPYPALIRAMRQAPYEKLGPLLEPYRVGYVVFDLKLTQADSPQLLGSPALTRVWSSSDFVVARVLPGVIKAP